MVAFETVELLFENENTLASQRGILKAFQKQYRWNQLYNPSGYTLSRPCAPKCGVQFTCDLSLSPA